MVHSRGLEWHYCEGLMRSVMYISKCSRPPPPPLLSPRNPALLKLGPEILLLGKPKCWKYFPKSFSSIQASAYWPGMVQMLSQATGILIHAKRLLIQGRLAILAPPNPPPPHIYSFNIQAFKDIYK